MEYGTQGTAWSWGARRVSNGVGVHRIVRKRDYALPARYTKHSYALGVSLGLWAPGPPSVLRTALTGSPARDETSVRVWLEQPCQLSMTLVWLEGPCTLSMGTEQDAL